MKILFYDGDSPEEWLNAFANAFPDAEIRDWKPGDNAPADYAVVWEPPMEMLCPRSNLKAIFNMGAGVDSLLSAIKSNSITLSSDIPIIRLEDGGMAPQMIEYVIHAVMGYFRRFDEYQQHQVDLQWKRYPAPRKEHFPIGIMGLGVLGTQVAESLALMGFPVRGWSRQEKQEEGIQCYASSQGLQPFLQGLKLLVNLLPLTTETENILNHSLFTKLAQGAYLINIARGQHLVDTDLLESLQSGQLAGARLDVFRTEPLPLDHPFWKEDRISITPHIAARTYVDECVQQIAEKIHALSKGEPVTGIIDLNRGY